MKRHLFLCGPSGCGKTYMLREILGPSMAQAGGFVTERIRTDDGTLLGYDLFPAAHAAGVEGFTEKRFLDYTQRPPISDNEVFRADAVRLLAEAEFYPFALVDEFGGYELVIPQFREALGRFLSSEVPCIGVLKSLPNAETLKKRMGLGEKYILLAQDLRAALDSDENTLVLDTVGRGDEAAYRAVEEWKREYVDV